jgi:hypothetical protein
MSAEDITRKALDQGFLKTKGATPAATMSASLYMDIKRKGKASKFMQTGSNQFSLNGNWEPQSPHKTEQTPPKVDVKRRKRGNVPSIAQKLLDREITLIHSFLSGKSEQPPTSEKICDWVSMCYSFGLFSEGKELFSYVDPDEVNDWYYERTKKMARLCILHGSNQ